MIRSRRTPVVPLIAAALALVVTLSGCTALLGPRVQATSTPTDETVSADLEPFYSQVLAWTDCEVEMQCATVTAPLDWEDPSRESIELSIIRSVATGDRQGSLLVNPGGPGGSGYDFVASSLERATTAELRAAYDIVGFDPRGVGRSSAVACYDDPAAFDDFIFGLLPAEYGSDEWISEYEKVNASFGQDCLAHTGELLGFVDTISAARDLDLLRAVLGDTKLNYLGFSYGTFLGATYADLYPEKTGRLVLDGALDPSTTSTDVSVSQAVGFENALRAYLKSCLATTTCEFGGTVDDAMKSIRSLLDQLNLSPLRNADGRELGSASMTTAIILPLYSEENWPYLDQLFASVKQGDASIAFQLADSYYGRDADGEYTDNSTEAFLSINCLDYTSDNSLESMRAEEAELIEAAPVLGQQLAYGGAGCASWPFEPTRDRVAIHAPGSADILVVGTTNDPATPYKWAVSLAEQLDNGHLVTYEGEGHTAYNRSNSCVNDAVDGYLINGVVPEADPKC